MMLICHGGCEVRVDQLELGNVPLEARQLLELQEQGTRQAVAKTLVAVDLSVVDRVGQQLGVPEGIGHPMGT